MKSLLLVCALLWAIPARTIAAILLAWGASGGFVPDAADETVGILAMGQNPTGQGLAQLIFTPSGTASHAIEGVHAAFVSGDNTLLASQVLAVGQPGTQSEFADFVGTQVYYDPVFTPGYVFVRVFERNLPDITSQTRYYDGPLLPLVERSPYPLMPPQTVDANRHDLAGGIGDALNDYVSLMSVAAIPEPGTFGLLILGIGAVAWRRKRAV